MEGNVTFNKWKIFTHMERERITRNHPTREKLHTLRNAKLKRGQAETPDPSKNLVELIGIEPTAS